MPKKAIELSALAVKRLPVPVDQKFSKFYAVGGVPGLLMQVTPTGARTWVLRASIAGRRRDMGLGSFPETSLAEAREKARKQRALIAEGIDPILAKRSQMSEILAAREKEITFETAAAQFMHAKSSEWKNAKHKQQWQNTLITYAMPVLGKLQVKDIDVSHLVKVLEPIWQSKTETASRLRGRIEKILDWAITRKYRSAENPARWGGNLETLFASPKKVSKTEHHKAIAIDAVPAFVKELKTKTGIGATALQFLVYTAARSGEVRGATWSEFDLVNKIWTIPADRMKMGKEHRVPLSFAAMGILKSLPKSESGFVFPSSKQTALSDMALTTVMRRMSADGVPHGFRSSFRDWAAERTNYPRDAAEMALAHSIGSKVEAAYRRGDLFEKRQAMMQEWADFCQSPVLSDPKRGQHD